MTILERYPVACAMAAFTICALIAGFIDGGAF